MNTWNIVTTIMISLIIISCNTTEPNNTSNYELTLIDVSVTESFLRIRGNYETKQEAILQRNGIDIFKFTGNIDTSLTDTGLEENSKYRYKIVVKGGRITTELSNEIIAITLKPTSHSFIWEKYLFGDFGYSEINDVEILNDNSIWAVGKLYMKDSLGEPEEQIYNALYYNGKIWKKNKIPSRIWNNDSFVINPLVSLFVSDNSDIWVTDGGQMIYGNGISWERWMFLFTSLTDSSFGEINQLWGINNTRIWAAGTNGNLYTISKNTEWSEWQKFPTNFKEKINDIWGWGNDFGNYYIIFPITDYNNYKNNKIMVYRNNGEMLSSVSNTERWTSTIWTNKGYPIFIAGDGIFENKNGSWTEIEYGENIVIEKIRGNAINDIIAVGHLGVVSHYNGIDWKIYPELSMNGIYKTVAIKSNIVIIAGIENNQAVLIIGKRN